MAAMLDVSGILGKYPSNVSGGQQQRASLGRAMVRKADLYLLDEPTGQWEPQLRAILRGRIKHYSREYKCTSILVTHDQTEANALADRIAVTRRWGFCSNMLRLINSNFGPQSIHWNIHR